MWGCLGVKCHMAVPHGHFTTLPPLLACAILVKVAGGAKNGKDAWSHTANHLTNREDAIAQASLCDAIRSLRESS